MSQNKLSLSDQARNLLFEACKSDKSFKDAKKIIDSGFSVDSEQTSGHNVWKPIHVASYYGSKKILSLLLSRGASVKAEADFGESPLFIACREGHSSIVEMLLDHGGDWKAKNKLKGEWTPLRVACYWGHREVVDVILNHLEEKSKDDFELASKNVGEWWNDEDDALPLGDFDDSDELLPDKSK